MPNKKISELEEISFLYSDSNLDPFPSHASINSNSDADSEALFLLTRSGSHNEKIKYSNLKKSLLGDVVFMTGDQLISGRKIFADECTFKSTILINEIIDVTSPADISGNIFVGESGLYEHLGLGDKFFLREQDVNRTLEVDGNSFFQGSVEITGDLTRSGPYHHRKGDTQYGGDFLITGDIFQEGNYYLSGTTRRLGDVSSTGNADFKSELNVYGNIRLGEYLYPHKENDAGSIQWFESSGNNLILSSNEIVTNNIALELWESSSQNSYTPRESGYSSSNAVAQYFESFDSESIMPTTFGTEILVDGTNTFLRFTPNLFRLQAGGHTSIELDTNKSKNLSFSTRFDEREVVSFTEEGAMGVMASDPMKDLSVSGDSFLENTFTTSNDGYWSNVFPGDDESMAFTTDMFGGTDEYLINFPKTFYNPPVLSVSVQDEKGGVIVPYMISGVTSQQYNVIFSSILPSRRYKVHTTAMATGIESNREKTIQRSVTELPAGITSGNINFPFGFSAPPVVSLTIEGSRVMVPHHIRNVTKDSYDINFSTPIPSGFKVHTTSILAGKIGRSPY